MATVQPKTFKATVCENHVNAIFNWIDIDKIENSVEIINKIKKNKSARDINSAEIIVAGGAGACKDNGFTLIYELAQKLNAAVAGTREAFEKGYAI